MTKMPGWPKPPGKGRKDTLLYRSAKFQQARADYWEARCRLAVTVLQTVGKYIYVLPGTIQSDFFDGCPSIDKTLAAIGPLPEQAKEE